MVLFLTAIAVLIIGYVVYGAFVTKVLGIDKKAAMPAYSKRDNVDFMPLPTWKVFMIQFLNIAGVGPIFGAIMGAMFGPAAFLWIVFGTIFAGAVHDFIAAMMSVRSGGDSLPELVGRELGVSVKMVMRVVTVILLLIVGALFIRTPATLLSGMTPVWLNYSFWIGAIFIYYALATMLPIDKLIGNLYPVFGFALLFMAGGLLCVLLFGGIEIPMGFEDGLFSRFEGDTKPVFPMMFVTIACGAISGFHATQSPMMARCLKRESLARPVFYGAMVAEGLVALIWAAAAIAFTGGYEQLHAFAAAHGDDTAADLVTLISKDWLGAVGGVLAILGVIAAPITTGDTALRSARLLVSDFMKVSQKTLLKRFLVCIPIFTITFAITLFDFEVLWRYFAWTNQLLAVFTLWAASVFLARHRKLFVITLLPAVFMTIVCVGYILYAPQPEGFGLGLGWALGIGGAVAALFVTLFVRYFVLLRAGKLVHEVGY